MNLKPIIEQIQNYCPSFKSVSGAAEINLDKKASVALPAAFVVMLDETGETVETEGNDYLQEITESFAVLVVLDNQTDERGQDAMDLLDPIRAELFKALVNWCPDEFHDEIRFNRGYLTQMNGDQLFYAYEFYTYTTLAKEDTWQQVMYESLGPLKKVHSGIDLQPTDGRIEAEFEVNFEKDGA